MQTSLKGIQLIEQFEGYSAKMYLDPAGLPSIGYGTLIDTEEELWLKTATIDRAQAELLLRKELVYIEKNINIMVQKTINQNQFDALISFTFNTGIYALRMSILLKKINTYPNDPTIRNEFMAWIWAGGRKLQGMINRRTAEANLYYAPMG